MKPDSLKRLEIEPTWFQEATNQPWHSLHPFSLSCALVVILSDLIDSWACDFVVIHWNTWQALKGEGNGVNIHKHKLPPLLALAPQLLIHLT